MHWRLILQLGLSASNEFVEAMNHQSKLVRALREWHLLQWQERQVFELATAWLPGAVRRLAGLGYLRNSLLVFYAYVYASF